MHQDLWFQEWGSIHSLVSVWSPPRHHRLWEWTCGHKRSTYQHLTNIYRLLTSSVSVSRLNLIKWPREKRSHAILHFQMGKRSSGGWSQLPWISKLVRNGDRCQKHGFYFHNRSWEAYAVDTVETRNSVASRWKHQIHPVLQKPGVGMETWQVR